MAVKAEKGNYISIEDVRASYDHKDDVVRLTTGDRDLSEKFSVTIKPGTPTDKTLRDVLSREGFIRDRFDSRPVIDATNAVLGSTGGVFFLAGSPGSGKSFLAEKIYNRASIMGFDATMLLHDKRAIEGDGGCFGYEREIAVIKDLIERVKSDYDTNRSNGSRYVVSIELDNMMRLGDPDRTGDKTRWENANSYKELVLELQSISNLGIKVILISHSPDNFGNFLAVANSIIVMGGDVEDYRNLALIEAHPPCWDITGKELYSMLRQLERFDYLIDSFGRPVVGRTE